jgi:hypothetical protein
LRQPDGVAIAKVEGRVGVQRLVDEQAALRRVATLVARGVEPAETFSAVSDEVAQLFAANGLVLRFEDDGTGIVSVGVSTGNDIPAGEHWNFEEGMASLEVYRTGRSARVDAFAGEYAARRLLQERRGRNAGLAADPVDEEHHLVDVAPAPVFARLE